MLQDSHDSYPVHYAAGRGTNLGKAKNVDSTWGDLCKLLSKPLRTAETRSEFDALSKDDQDVRKAAAGWIMGAPVRQGQRTAENIESRDLLTLDFDYVPLAFLEEIELGVTPFSHFEFFVHSTRRHTKKTPRIRLFAPLKRPVTPDEYVVLARLLAAKLEGKTPLTMTDKVSFRKAQMMFRPTASSNGEWFHYRNEGVLIDPDAVLASVADWQDHEQWPRCEGETNLRMPAKKAQDPTTKRGPVGDFCRTYDVPAAIEKFLPDLYAPVDGYSTKPRYTYRLGTSSSGAVVEDDGKFLYSHHGSDPACDQLLNAFDLVRVHLYGDEDTDADRQEKPNMWPSYKAMVAFIADDPEYRHNALEARYGAVDQFEDLEPNGHMNGYDADIAELIGEWRADQGETGDPGVRPGDPGWMDALALDQNNRIRPTINNIIAIIENDRRLIGTICFNEFIQRTVVRRTIKPHLPTAATYQCRDRANGDRLQDRHALLVRTIIEAAPNDNEPGGYGLSITDRNVVGAIEMVAHRHSFHPVRDYLDGLSWDKSPRMDSFLIRYMGCPDTAYHREIARLKLIASVARIYEPGCKFDYAIILQGKTGIRKSSAVKALYGDEWFGELDCRLDNPQQIAETILGIWGGELPELAGMHKSEVNELKAFMRRQHDDVRMAYGRYVTEFPRQCIFWGTTNDRKYLKDPTGNRSYWPVVIMVEMIDTTGIAAERDQLWAEAVLAYRAMRAANPVGDLPFVLSPAALAEAGRQQEEARTQELHEHWTQAIRDWLDKPVPLHQLLVELGEDAGRVPDVSEEVLVLRVAFTLEQALTYALKKDRPMADYIAPPTIAKALSLLAGWNQGTRPYVRGVQKRWWLRNDVTREELKLGYRAIESLI